MRKSARLEKRKAINSSTENANQIESRKDESPKDATTLEALQKNGIEYVAPMSDLQEEFERKHSSKTNIEVFSVLNPRQTQNIPAKEKVTKWMRTLPYQQVNGEFWVTNCYSGSTSTGTETDSIDCAEVQDIQELQSRKITRYVTQMYYMDDQPVRGGEEVYSLIEEQSMDYDDFENQFEMTDFQYTDH